MTAYAILAHPGQNRVYFDSTQALFLQEFRAVATRHPAGISQIDSRTVGGVPYVAFHCNRAFLPEELPALQQLSFFYALFELENDGDRPALLPVEAPDCRYFPDSLSTLLKYSGKTNERFTRLMLNLARSCCAYCKDGPLHLLDPMCGKGTTLHEGLIDGLDVAGVEINPAWWQEAKTYLIKFLETGRYKHKASSETVRGAGGKKIADVFQLLAANSKAGYDGGDVRTVRLVNGDTRLADRFFRRESFDLLVADLPYGVQHAGKGTRGGGAAAHGDLAALLAEALPGWIRLMVPGGAMALGFNTFTLKKSDLVALLDKHGLAVKREAPYHDFLHRVDQGINRDLVVAVKPLGQLLGSIDKPACR